MIPLFQHCFGINTKLIFLKHVLGYNFHAFHGVFLTFIICLLEKQVVGEVCNTVEACNVDGEGNDNKDAGKCDKDFDSCSVVSTATITSDSSSLGGFSAQRQSFKEDFRKIFTSFGMLITGTGSISQKRVEEMAIKSSVCAELIEKYGIYRMTEKIRTERKKFVKEKM